MCEFRPQKWGRNYAVGIRLGAQVKTAPAGALTPVLRGLTPDKEGLVPNHIRAYRQSAIGGAA